MSDCGVCLYSDYDNCDGMIDDVAIVKLDINKRCSECRGLVLAGSDIEEARWYEEWDSDEEDDAPTVKHPIYTCLVCAEIADAFYCDGRMYGADLWDALHETMGSLNSGCFNRLKTPQAKAELQRRWMEWKGLKD